MMRRPCENGYPEYLEFFSNERRSAKIRGDVRTNHNGTVTRKCIAPRENRLLLSICMKTTSRSALAALTVALLILCGACAGDRVARPYLAAAEETAKWLRSTAIDSTEGFSWPADPNDTKTVSNNLYSGGAGVVLFFIELYQSTGDAEYLNIAKRGGDFLVASIPARAGGEEAGLYTGVAGVGYALYELYKVSEVVKYRDAASRVVDLLESSASRDGDHYSWGAVNDIISGKAGVGLFLLYAHKKMKHPKALPLAEGAARSLLTAAHDEGGALRWSMEESYKRNLPNFSHGTAGVAFFLARLYEITKNDHYLSAALGGARYLENIGDKTDGGFRVFHADPDGKDRYYLGYCHGPAGTSRLFHQLGKITNDGRWHELTIRCATAIHASGIPRERTPGFWNNVSQCCGSAGVAEFLLYQYECEENMSQFHPRETPAEFDSLALARELTDDLLHRAERDERGLRFPQAEHRAKPELVNAQTGYAQGAAGVGLWLLHLDAYDRGQTPRITLPDHPSAWY